MDILNKVIKSLSINNLRGRISIVGKAQNTIISAAFVLSISSGLSAILGLLKGRFLTNYFGVSNALGVFYTADKIPNLIYSVLVVGALSTVFIPVFTEQLQKDKKIAWETASSIITGGLAIFIVISTITFIFAPQIMIGLSLGKFTSEEIVLGTNLMRIMTIAQLILVLSSFLTSILQSFRIFLAPALAPVLYNGGMLIGIITLSKSIGIYGPAIGVLIGAFLHLIIQIPALKGVNFDYALTINPKNKGIKKMMFLMPPRIISVIINQSISTISNSLAILISTSSVIILRFSSQLQFFPVHLFGASMAAAALPVLSEHANSSNKDKFKKIFLTTLHQMLFLVMPASMLFLILRVPIVRLVYGTSNFPWEATIKTSYALAFFSMSIFTQSCVYLITRAFYAQKDTKTPVKTSLLALLTSVSLAYYLVKVLGMGVWAIAFAFSAASYIEMVVLIILISKKLGGFAFEELFIPFIKISYATLFMGMFIYTPLKLLDRTVFDTSRTTNLLVLTFITGILGISSYLFFTKTFHVAEIELFYKLLRRFKLKAADSKIPGAVVQGTLE